MCEYLDLVDSEDHPIGVRERNWFYDNHCHHYRVINVFCENSQGEILVLRKSKSCKRFAGMYDFSVGGHVRSGETYEEAACREIYEEIGLRVASESLIEVAYLRFPNRLNTSSFSKLFYVPIGEYSPILSDENDSYFYYDKDQLKSELHIKPFKSDYEELFHLFYLWRIENE